MAKRDYQCTLCRVIVTGRQAPDGTVRADNGPPSGEPMASAICRTCQDRLSSLPPVIAVLATRERPISGGDYRLSDVILMAAKEAKERGLPAPPRVSRWARLFDWAVELAREGRR